MLKYERLAAEIKPYDHVRVRSGRILPDDLVYSWTTNEFLRHDDPSWLSTCEWVGQAVYVVRKGNAPMPKAKTPEIQDLERLSVPDTEQLPLF
jgi:hypothetical protein